MSSDLNSAIIFPAITFGLVAGLQPGPLGVFVIHQMMSKGNRAGLLSSLIPLVTDLPIILFVLLVLPKVNQHPAFLTYLSFIGAAYLAFVAFKMIGVPNIIYPRESHLAELNLRTGIKMNLLNPAPYLFWGLVGSAYILQGSLVDAVSFIFCVLFVLCTTKYCVAGMVKLLGDRFSARVYVILLKSLALPMMFFSVKLLLIGIEQLSS